MPELTTLIPVVMAAGLATFREVLTREAFEHVGKLNKKLVDGYNQILKKMGLIAYTDGAGANGALMFYPHRDSQLSRLVSRGRRSSGHTTGLRW